MKTIMIVICLLTSSIWGANFAELTKTSAYPLSVGAIGFERESSVLFSNPAALQVTGASSFFTSLMQNRVKYGALSIATKTPYGNVGFGYVTEKIDAIPLTSQDSSGIISQTGSFNFEKNLLSLAYGFQVSPPLRFGASVSRYASNLHGHKGEGYRANLGALFTLSPISISLVGQNVFTTDIQYVGEIEPLPMRWVIGLKTNPFKGVSIFAQGTSIKKQFLRSLGAEYFPLEQPLFSIQASISEMLLVNNTIKARAAFGLGFNVAGIGLNMAYQKSDFSLHEDTFFVSLNLTI